MGGWRQRAEVERRLEAGGPGDFREKEGVDRGMDRQRGEEGIGTSKIPNVKKFKTFQMEAVNSQEGGVGVGRGPGETN